MIEKVKLNEVAKDLNISGKDLTALLQQRFGGEAKKPQTVLSGEELNFVMEHYTQQHADKHFGEYPKLGENQPAPAAVPVQTTLEDLYLFHFADELGSDLSRPAGGKKK